MRSLVVVLTICLHLVLAEVSFIDLTHTFGKKTVYWPVNPPFNFSNAVRLDIPNAVVEFNYFQTAEHSGTHMDAPRHFCPQGKFVHQIPLDKLSGPGVVLDFKSQVAQNYDYKVSVQDIKKWEAQHGAIPKGAVVLFNFGWNKYWPDWEKIYNSNDFTDFLSFHFPGLGEEVSQYLAETRRVHAVGVDTPTPDQPDSAATHINLLCKYGVIILENVANLDVMPTTGSHVFIGAIKLENGSGTPARLFATVDDYRLFPSGAGAITSVDTPVRLIVAILSICAKQIF